MLAKRIVPIVRTSLPFAVAVAMVLLSTACSDGSDRVMDVSPSYDARVTVNDPDAIGVVGDELLSLAEAIQLGNGTLAMDALSSEEAGQVSGTPGPASRDDIRFDVADGAVRFPLQIQEKLPFDYAILTPQSRLPAMTGNDGDAITGAGIRFTNGADDAIDTINQPPFYNGAPLGGLALVVRSSDITISDVTFERFISAMQVEPSSAGGLANITIANNRFHNGGGLGVSATTASGERGSLISVRVQDNDFSGPEVFGERFPSTFHTAIFISGASTATASSIQDGVDVLLSDISVTGNTIDQFGTGVQVQPLQAIGVHNGHAKLDGLLIENNVIVQAPEAFDPPIYVWGAVNVLGSVTDIEVSGVAIRDNTVSGNGYLIFVTGLEVLLAGSTPSRDVTFDGISITGNSLKPITGCTVGITTIAAFLELGGSTVSNASMKNVEITGNQITGCAWGALATPVYNVGAPDISSGNTLEGLRFADNQFADTDMGIVIAGGTLVADAFGGAAGVESNTVSEVAVSDNRFTATELGVLIAGGLARGSADGLVSSNAVFIDRVDANAHADESNNPVCQIQQDAAMNASALVSGNQVSGNAGCE